MELYDARVDWRLLSRIGPGSLYDVEIDWFGGERREVHTMLVHLSDTLHELSRRMPADCCNWIFLCDPYGAPRSLKSDRYIAYYVRSGFFDGAKLLPPRPHKNDIRVYSTFAGLVRNIEGSTSMSQLLADLRQHWQQAVGAHRATDYSVSFDS